MQLSDQLQIAGFKKDDLQRSFATYDFTRILTYLSVHVLLVACESAMGSFGIWVWKRDTQLTYSLCKTD